MIKLFKNNPELRKNAYLLGVLILAIVFYRYTENAQIGSVLPFILNILSPFIIGAVLAYVLNCGVRAFELHVFNRIKPLKERKGLQRGLSIFISMLLLLGIVIAIIAYIVPEIISSVQNVINFLVEIDFEKIRGYANDILKKYNIQMSVQTYRSLLDSLQSALNSITDGLKYVPNLLVSVMAHVISFASSAIDMLIGIFVAVYLLSDKEKLVAFGKKTLYLFFSGRMSRKIINTVKVTNKTFYSFFVGKTIDSLIIGLIYLIVASILQLPYPTLSALIIGLTNMIPYFGPFIGAVPVILLVLLNSPIKALWTLIFIVILQQFDGIILGPKILGDSIGLKPLGVIFAITVGGALAGPLGMFFGVPIFSVIVSAFSAMVEKNYIKKTTVEKIAGASKRYRKPHNRNKRRETSEEKSSEEKE